MSDDRIDDEAQHSSHGPSGAEGWATCADYINANRGLPDDSGELAAEGTAAHAIRDTCLSLGFDAFDFFGTKTRIKEWVFEWNDDDADLLQPGIERIRSLGGRFFSEHRVDISKWTVPNQFGTLDAGIITPSLIHIDDLKWGRGVPVSPVENKQLMLYALGFWDKVARHHTDATEFELSIDQPRCSGGGGTWRTNIEQLLNFGDWIKGRAEATMQPNPPRTASAKGCMWCKRRSVAGGCDTYDEFNLMLFGSKFDEELDLDVQLGAPPLLPRLLTPERRAYILEHRSMLERWLEQMADAELADALAGHPTPGRKAVEGRKGRDVWHDAEAAEAAVVPILGENSFTKKLKTPSQVGKEVRSDEDRSLLDPLIKRGVKKPTMVPEADARPSISTAQSKFDEEDEKED